MLSRIVFVVAMSSLSLMATGCGKSSSSAATGASETGLAFSATDIEGAHASACTVGSDPITGANRYRLSYNFIAGGNFNASVSWFNNSCTGGNYTAVYGTSGTYSVSGNTINMVVTASDLMPMSNAAQTTFNSNCGGTSPFSGGVSSGNNGGHFSSYMMLCSSATFPNSGNKNVSNSATWDGTDLTVGAPYSTVGGQFSGTAPGAATILLNQ